MEKVNLAEKLTLITGTGVHKIVGALNGQKLKLVKFRDLRLAPPRGGG